MSKLTQDLRRPFGVAGFYFILNIVLTVFPLIYIRFFILHFVLIVMDVTDFIKKKVDIDEDKERFLPLLMYAHKFIFLECFLPWMDNADKIIYFFVVFTLHYC